MRCALEIQENLASGGSPLRLRVGLNLGDVIVGQDGELYGDGINIAVRLEGIADPGGVLISEKVYSEVEGKLDVGFEDRGGQKLKNISKPVHAYAVCTRAHSAPIEKLGAAQTVIPTRGARTHEVVSFGPFRLFPSERVLKKADETVKLSSRAFDILLALVQQAGEVVDHRELIAKVWPGIFVEEVTLRVHITVLRKALDTGEGGERYLTNVPGRGYCLVAPTSRDAVSLPSADDFPEAHYTLPQLLVQMVGRDEIVSEICHKLTTERFVTIVGPGGLGKTTVALSVAHTCCRNFLAPSALWS